MFASVIIDQDTKALNKVFNYLIPDGMKIEKGFRVIVPFGQRLVQGFVVEVNEKIDFDLSKIKQISSTLDDEPIIKSEMLELMKFMCNKFHLRLTSVLRLFVPSEIREGKVKDLFVKWASLNGEIDIQSFSRANVQKSIIEELIKKQKVLLAELKRNY